ncbi:uncharacterized protein [Vulpes vulpes]|uniref:Leucine-rich repeat-containing protein 29 n=1 Tax=Vulpes vulpes TaxID=9627 RepID=A0ABM4YC22_VULVU
MPIAQPEMAQLVQQVWSGLCELNLAGLRDLTDLSFSQLRHCAPNLERLSLAYCHLTFELGPAQGSLGPQDFSCSQLSFHNLLQFVKERAGRLCGLDLSGTGLLPEAAKALAQVAGLQLKELSLRACQDLSTGAVAALCRLQSGLTSLDLSGCSELADRALLAISRGLACLQCLRLRKLQRLTDTGCTALGALRELHSLNLAECGRVSGWGLARALGSGRRAPAPLASLSLAYCSSLKVSPSSPPFPPRGWGSCNCGSEEALPRVDGQGTAVRTGLRTRGEEPGRTVLPPAPSPQPHTVGPDRGRPKGTRLAQPTGRHTPPAPGAWRPL